MSLFRFLEKTVDAVVAVPIRLVKSTVKVVTDDAPAVSIVTNVVDGAKKDYHGIVEEVEDITEKK
jgi:hypothetical protein